VLGIVVVDPVPFDYQAVKSLALMVGAALCLGGALAARRFGGSSLSIALWVFVAVRGAMLLNSPMTNEAVRSWGLLLALVLVHHAASGAATRTWFARRAPPIYGVLLALLAGLVLVQELTGVRQNHALFANRNFAGAGLAMLLPFALAARRRRPLALAGVLGLALVGSRGGYLAGGAALALWLVWRRPRLRLPVLVGLPVLVLAAGLVVGRTDTVDVRLHWYRAALDMGLERPVLGQGAGGFEREYPPRRPIEEHRISGGRRVHAVHDDYLESFAEGGLLGLGAHLLLLVAAARAARRNRLAACSLLAFAVASLVDLPLRDPSLLALAFLPLSLAARRRRLGRGSVVAAAVGLVCVLAFLPDHLSHWRADRLFGRHLASGEAALLDRSLEIEPRHREAALARSGASDLALLIEMEPHNAAARYNATRGLSRDRRIEELRRILIEHDHHHTLTRVGLAKLLLDEDPLQAASILADAVDADPRPYEPHVLLARIHRRAGNPDLARRQLGRIGERPLPQAVAREWLDLELEGLRSGRWSQERLASFAARLPAAEIEDRIQAAFARAEETERAAKPPRHEPREGESAIDFAGRVQAAREGWRRELSERTAGDYRTASVLAGILTTLDPSPSRYRLVARAQRGLGELEPARRAEASAGFLETLEALRDGRDGDARRLWKRALRAWPGIGEDGGAAAALRLFLAANPKAGAAARRLFARHPVLAAALSK
jgi:O-antigen ligase